MKKTTILNLAIAGCVIGLFTGCAPTKVSVMEQHAGQLPKPSRVYVYNFAVSPDEVTLDSGVTAKIEDLIHKKPRTDQERAIGRQCAEALAAHLVKEIAALGLPANRAYGAPPADEIILTVRGQFISINEGNQTERMIIGLGAGRTSVKTYTQVYDVQNGGRSLANEFETDAKSGYKPGAAETMGAGAAAGHLVTSAVVTAGTTAVSETVGATVEADADRTAKQIAGQLKQYFVSQGWVLPSK